jgi:hypothetical protein
VQGTPEPPDVDASRQNEIVTAFLAASRGGDFEALLEILDPEVMLRADEAVVALGGAPELVRGATAVASTFSGRAQAARLTLVDGLAGAVWSLHGEPKVVFNFTVTDGRITTIELLGNPDYLQSVTLVPIEP